MTVSFGEWERFLASPPTFIIAKVSSREAARVPLPQCELYPSNKPIKKACLFGA